MRKFGCVLLLFSLGACAAPPGPKFEASLATPKSDLAKIVLYHTGISGPIRGESIVLLDGEAVCFIAPGEVMTKDLAPGEHKISFDTPMTPGISVLGFKAEAGKTSFVSASMNGKRMAATFFFGGLGALASSDSTSPNGGSYALEEVSEGMGIKETEAMAQCDCKRRGA